HAGTQLRDESLCDPLLRKAARARAADLSLVEPDGIDDALDNAVEVGVLEHDEGRLPAQLERQLLARAGRGRADDAADLRRSGERALVDVGMRHEGSARVAVAGDDVDATGRRADLAAELRGAERRWWRVLGGLQAKGVGGGESRRDVAGGHARREMPREDLPDDGDGLVLGE